VLVLSYCAGASTTLDAGAGFASYSWSSGETTQTISATAGNYTVTVTDSNGCSNTSAQVTVTELALPTVAISGTLSYCAGSNTTLTATAGLSSYLWSSGETTQSITATAGSYTVTGTDANGCSNTSSSVTVTETPLDNAGFSYSASSYEPTDADPTPTITGLTGGTFSGTTGLVINSTTGEIDLSASTVATHTITYDTTSSGSSVCPNTSTQTVEIAVAGIANNYSMNFDSASADYIYLGNNDVFSFGNGSNDSAVSFSAWVYVDSASWFFVLDKYPFSGSSYSLREYRFDISPSQEFYVIFYDTSGSNIVMNSNSTISLNQWQHIAFTYDGRGGSSAEDGVNIYLNGSPTTFATAKSGTYTAMNNTTQAATIGRLGTSYADGKIDEVAIWNTALTSTQVAEIYNATESYGG
jgi:hypothetical protein